MSTKDLYLQSSLEQSKILTKAYSSSFSRSLDFVDVSIRPAIYAIYGMVRIADEIVDTQFTGAQALEELDQFEREVFLAIQKQYSSNPILHAFQWVARTNDISPEYIKSFFHSMRLDTKPQKYTQSLYEEYIYGSAEVVGLMSLSVFCKGDKKLEQELSGGAKSLGAAFQKVNFLRDIQSDWVQRKRLYFPDIDILPLTTTQKVLIENDIARDFETAKEYIQNLPEVARRGVKIAYDYYFQLFLKIQAMKPEELSKRASVGRTGKALIFAKAMIGRK